MKKIFLTTLIVLCFSNTTYSYDSTKYAICYGEMTKAHKARGFHQKQRAISILSGLKNEKKIKNLVAIDDCVCQVFDAPVIGKSYKLLYVGELSKESVRYELKTFLKKYEMPVLIKKVKEIGFGKNFKKIR